jgi:hypothetical protein
MMLHIGIAGPFAVKHHFLHRGQGHASHQCRFAVVLHGHTEVSVSKPLTTHAEGESNEDRENGSAHHRMLGPRSNAAFRGARVAPQFGISLAG